MLVGVYDLCLFTADNLLGATPLLGPWVQSALAVAWRFNASRLNTSGIRKHIAVTPYLGGRLQHTLLPVHMLLYRLGRESTLLMLLYSDTTTYQLFVSNYAQRTACTVYSKAKTGRPTVRTQLCLHSLSDMIQVIPDYAKMMFVKIKPIDMLVRLIQLLAAATYEHQHEQRQT